MQKIITDRIIYAIVEDVAVSTAISKICSFAASQTLTVIAIEGMLKKAGDASDRLKVKYPGLWYRLSTKGYDMLYFIFKNELNKIFLF
ncbi:hypothetical protein [Acetobacter thailandicus]|uniref:hypothetical protein n=1 Tax=Acetobacter thailandicus TaxID=1502842 RepID=UPI001A7E4BB6|nr:hypothetical protein [Acetobacter thailandicus]